MFKLPKRYDAKNTNITQGILRAIFIDVLPDSLIYSEDNILLHGPFSNTLTYLFSNPIGNFICIEDNVADFSIGVEIAIPGLKHLMIIF